MAKQTLRAECLMTWIDANGIVQKKPKPESEPVDVSNVFDILTNIKKQRRK